MGIFKALVKLFKGGNHTGRTEESVSGGNGRERPIIHLFSSVRERAVSDIRGIRMLAAACADERSRDIGTFCVDYKRAQYAFQGASDTQNAEWLKDILCFANPFRRSPALRGRSASVRHDENSVNSASHG